MAEVVAKVGGNDATVVMKRVNLQRIRGLVMD